LVGFVYGDVAGVVYTEWFLFMAGQAEMESGHAVLFVIWGEVNDDAMGSDFWNESAVARTCADWSVAKGESVEDLVFVFVPICHGGCDEQGDGYEGAGEECGGNFVWG